MRPRKQQSGFALLFVMAAAAIIGIMLYMEMPRVAFEAQRAKETDLITRGEQYKRAIKLFFMRFNRYPASISDLENTNNIRFLRRRYKDPMTGKAEWRFIHVAGGIFTDSLTVKPPAPKGTTDATQMAASSSNSGSGDSGGAQPAVPRWQLQRGGQPPSPEGYTTPDQQDQQDTGEETDYAQQQREGAPGAVVIPGAPNATDLANPGATQPPVPQPGQPGYAPGQLSPGQPGYQQMQQPGVVGYQVPGAPGFQPGSQMPTGQRGYRPGVPVYGSPNQPNYPPVVLPGMPSNLANNPSNQGDSGQSGSGSSQSGFSSTGSVFGTMPGGGGAGGIAGVASKLEVEGIKIYRDHSKYNEWEFIYDPRQDVMALGLANPNQTNLPGQNPQFGNQVGAPGVQVPTTQQPGTQPGNQNPSGF